ncbi:MAG TPA: YaiI/YqxD family protein [Bacillales bacterium]|nr:YaiI/YqxD family protein [Bacillales bacterium]
MSTILVDADACPVIDITIKVAKHFNLPVILICDTAHFMERAGAETIMVSKGSDAVDFVLVNRVQEGDIVVTQDYGLAAMVLAKRGYPIDQNGRIYSSENIDQLLFSRHLAKKIRQAGGRTKGPKKRQKEADSKFEESLKKLIVQAKINSSE